MIKKFIDPLISIVIIVAVFSIVLFVIFGQQKALDEQLKASIVSYKAVQLNNQTLGKQVVSKAREQMETMITSNCTEQAYEDFTAKWNEECQNQGLEDKCSLPREIADPLIKEYEEAESGCY